MVGMVKMARMVRKVGRNNSVFVVESVKTLGKFVKKSTDQVGRILDGGYLNHFGKTIDKTENGQLLGV